MTTQNNPNPGNKGSIKSPKNFLKILSEIFTILFQEWTNLSREMSLMSRPILIKGKSINAQSAAMYLRAIKRFAFWMIVIPILILSIAMVTDDYGWLIATVGFVWLFFSTGLAISLYPIIVLINTLSNLSKKIRGGAVNSKKNWVDGFLGVLLVESFVSLCFAIIPVSNYPKAVPIALLGVMILAFWSFKTQGGKGFEKISKALSIIVIIVSLIYFWKPEIPKAFVGMTNKAGDQLATAMSDSTTATPSTPDHFLKKVALKGEDELSDPIDASDIPAFWDFWFYAPNPQNTFVEAADKDQLFSLDGESMGITKGPWRFYGPAGDTVSALFLPEGTEPPRTPPTK